MTAAQFKQIDRLFLRIGKLTSFCTTILVFMVLVDVIARYLFAQSAAWLTELEWHVFSLIFLYGTIYTLQYDAHVRVDVWYTKMPLKKQLWVNLIGTLVFLMPWCLIIIISSFQYAAHSWSMNEVSADPGGLAYRYVIKFAMTVSFLLLLLYGVFFVLKCAWRLSDPEVEVFIKKQRD